MMSEQDMDSINSGDESYHDIISTEMLQHICDRSQTHLNVNIRDARYKISVSIRQRQLEWEGGLKAMRITGKGLRKVFSTIVKDIFARIGTFGIIWFISFPFYTRTYKLFLSEKIIREHKETLAKSNSHGDKESNQQ